MIKFDNLSDETPYRIFREKYEDSLKANQRIIEAICISSFSSKINWFTFGKGIGAVRRRTCPFQYLGTDKA